MTEVARLEVVLVQMAQDDTMRVRMGHRHAACGSKRTGCGLSLSSGAYSCALASLLGSTRLERVLVVHRHFRVG
jgi:hypothetical protein